VAESLIMLRRDNDLGHWQGTAGDYLGPPQEATMKFPQIEYDPEVR
jgi:hypothetical protein